MTCSGKQSKELDVKRRERLAYLDKNDDLIGFDEVWGGGVKKKGGGGQ